MPKFGNLRQVDLRTGWNHEAFDFTQWLVKPENLQFLSDEIGIGRVGYEIPFTRHFYEYEPPRDLEEIEGEIQELEKVINSLLKEVIN